MSFAVGDRVRYINRNGARSHGTFGTVASVRSVPDGHVSVQWDDGLSFAKIPLLENIELVQSDPEPGDRVRVTLTGRVKNPKGLDDADWDFHYVADGVHLSERALEAVEVLEGAQPAPQLELHTGDVVYRHGSVYTIDGDIAYLRGFKSAWSARALALRVESGEAVLLVRDGKLVKP